MGSENTLEQSAAEATEAVGCILTQQPEREPSLARSMVDCPAGAVLIAGPPMPAQPLRARDGSRSDRLGFSGGGDSDEMQQKRQGTGGLQLKLRALRLVTSAATNSKTCVQAH